MKKVVGFLILPVILTCSPLFSLCQNNEDNVSLTLDRSDILTSGNELLTVLVTICNKTGSRLNGTLHISVPGREIELVSKSVVPVVVGEKDSLYIPVKLYAPSRAQAGRKYRVDISLKDDKRDVVLEKKQCAILVNEKRSLLLYPLTPALQIENNTDSLRIPLRIVNQGNVSQSITIVCGFPTLSGGNNFHASAQLRLNAWSDTVLYFKKKLVKEMLRLESFDASIKGIYPGGEIFAIASVKIQTARSVRSYTGGERSEEENENYLTIGSDNMLNSFKSYLLSSFISTPLSSGTLSCNLDATMWDNSNAQPLLKNTWLNLDLHNWAIRLGNISRNYEMNLSGRGAAMCLKDSLEKNVFETGLIDKTYNLIGSSANGNYSQGSSCWAAYSHKKNTFSMKSIMLFDKSNYLNSTSSILNNELGWDLGTVRVSAIINTGLSSNHQQSTKFGSAAGLSFDGRFRSISFAGTNFLSQRSYPGLRKGTTSVAGQINWFNSSFTYWCAMNIYRYSPGTGSNQGPGPLFKSQKFELGFSVPVSKNILCSFSPNYRAEKSNYYFAGAGRSETFLNSWNIGVSGNYLLSADQSLALTTESGFFEPFYTDNSIFHFKISSSYRNKSFSVISSFQQGSFFLGELQNCYSKKKSCTQQFTISPSYQKGIIRQKGNLNISLSYLNSNVSGKNISLNSRLDFLVFPDTFLFSGLTLNKVSYDAGGYQSNNVQVGLTQKFKPLKVISKGHALNLMLYKDINENGIYDQRDSIVGDQPLLINDVIFLTTKNGRIVYKNVPDASYTISVPYVKGWYAPPQQIYVNKDLTIGIPLQKTGIVTGKIAFSANELSYEVPLNKEGIMITAKNTEGLVFNAKTGEDGQFTFYLPSGNYTVSIQEEHIPAQTQCANNDQSVLVSSSGEARVFFNLKVKSRKTETRKFKSNHLQN